MKKSQLPKFLLFVTIIYFVLGGVTLLYFAAVGNTPFELILFGLVIHIFTALIFAFVFKYVYGLISERKAQEEENSLSFLNKFFDYSNMSVCVFDNTGKIRYVNANFATSRGKTKDSILGTEIKNYFEKFEEIFKEVKNRWLWVGEVTVPKTDGTSFYELSNIVMLPSRDNYLLISVDISDMKKSIIRLEEEKNKFELLNKIKTQFLSNLSQEIRTPMSGIIGMAELLLLTHLTNEQKEYIDIINFSSSTLLAIINDILDFSRIESGKLKLERVDFNIKELVYKTSQILDFDAKRKKIAFKVNIQDNIDYNVIGDPLRVNQILINLLRNAVKYTEKGVVEFSLEELSRDENKTVLKFTFNDTGIGMSKDKVELLFKEMDVNAPFELLQTLEYRGFGLGLSIVKYIVYKMGGKITAESEEGVGSKITVILPFELRKKKMEVSEHIELTERYKTEIIEEIKPIKKKTPKILVAEDNHVNQKLVKELLSKKNYNVTVVENGLKIFDVLEQNDFDLILMDIQMPIMDGLEATAIIREIEKGTGKHIPIIGITAYAVKADRDKCLEAGMDDYLAKPFVKEEFYRMIEKYLRLPR
ncbi:MAG: response regulator [Ignavibacteria bacterium]